jgi:hypothetical protein
MKAPARRCLRSETCDGCGQSQATDPGQEVVIVDIIGIFSLQEEPYNLKVVGPNPATAASFSIALNGLAPRLTRLPS